ncbi:fatty acid alpha-hydroxylase [Entomortierella chlamydospora]|uniref:Ceramide very long chain fatty acid hydroxylase n=1 Tax=Entomortierella chlamydospora TaxID=101097 RepID=A0A9P6SZV2_9FUNG|nr:fatty acid alpha-hydroxylase [Entomortierella chlamydospora]KAG0013402.1 fatty acid alpha-hydroxylase [Entomortierella chlamydospora]
MSVQTYTLAQVQDHNNADSCWVILNNNVYDVTSFITDHPGGEELILDYAGKDISLIMKDELSHLHSEGAYEMLDEFLVGTIGTQDSVTASLENTTQLHKRSTVTTTSTTSSADESDEAYLKPTDLVADKKSKFLDLSQPLLWQLWNSNFTKAFYLEQVHIPRHLSGPARIFGSPYLEVFTKTPWFVIPIFWSPVIAYFFHMSIETGLTPDQSATFFLAGTFGWTLAEYVIHRFLFHLDDLLPESTFSLVAHFLLHGIHHYLPMDRLRLVMPPALAVALAIPINKIIHTLLPTPQAYAFMSGLIFGYVLYDLTHYYLHHARVFKVHFREMKTYHLAHHYKNYEGGYGITSKIWDRVFNTELQL